MSSDKKASSLRPLSSTSQQRLVKRVKEALGQPAHAGTPPDLSESFRRSRSSLGDITADLQRRRRHAQSTARRTPRAAKSK